MARPKQCQNPYCINPRTKGLVYYGKEICDRCWDRHCNGDINLKLQLGIREELAEMEYIARSIDNGPDTN